MQRKKDSQLKSVIVPWDLILSESIFEQIRHILMIGQTRFKRKVLLCY